MPDSTPLPVSSPPPPAPVNVPPIITRVKKTQEELNIEVYEKVFQKCMQAADRLLGNSSNNNAAQQNKVTIAAAIFDRFYNDQTAMKAGAVQAKAMIDGMHQVLEGRR